MIPLRPFVRMDRRMNPATPTRQLPRIIAISGLVLVLLTMALVTRRNRADTIHTIGEPGRTLAFSPPRAF